MAQLQKQKKKANKKAPTTTETAKDAGTQELEPTEDAAVGETASTDGPAEEKVLEEGTVGPDEPTDAAQGHKEDVAIESTEPMPPAPTSPDPDTEPDPAPLDTPRGHGRQPSLSIQSKMRSSSFRKTSVSQGSASPSSAIKSPKESLPPLTGDGESVHEVFQKQSTRIAELEKENKRLEKELADATARWRKTEEQVEDLREASVDGDALRQQLKVAEEKVASIESLVGRASTVIFAGYLMTDPSIEGRNCCATATELPASISFTSQQFQRCRPGHVGLAACRSGAPVGVKVNYY